MSKVVYIIDGTSWIFRSYFGIGPMESPDGVPVNAVFGWVMTMMKFLKDHPSDEVVVCFDAGSKTFRHDIYPEYKANRGEAPEDLKPQFDLCIEACTRFGVRSVMGKGYEADDYIASIALAISSKSKKAVIVSNDKDLRQIVSKNILIFDWKSGELWGPKEIKEIMGIHPHQVTEYQGLVGDSVDNVPGVKGIGAKAATEILSLGKEMKAIFSDLSLLDSLKLRGLAGIKEKLKTGEKAFEFSKKLVTLKGDLKGKWLDKGFKKFKLDFELFDEFCERLGFERFKTQIRSL